VVRAVAASPACSGFKRIHDRARVRYCMAPCDNEMAHRVGGRRVQRVEMAVHWTWWIVPSSDTTERSAVLCRGRKGVAVVDGTEGARESQLCSRAPPRFSHTMKSDRRRAFVLRYSAVRVINNDITGEYPIDIHKWKDHPPTSRCPSCSQCRTWQLHNYASQAP
jgi:hypothetical protein